MVKLFTALSHALEGSPFIAVLSSLIWGVLSIILSPCHLAAIPLIIGYLSSRSDLSTRKAFQYSTLFSLGILISIAIIGTATAIAGRMIGDIGKPGRIGVALVFFIFGLNLIGVFPMNWTGLGQVKPRKQGFWQVLALGFVFGIGLGPCTFAFMAPLLGIAFNLSAESPLTGLLLLSAFAVGHCSVIIAAGTSSRWVTHLLKWNEKSHGVQVMRKICGILVLIGGIYLIYTTIQH